MKTSEKIERLAEISAAKSGYVKSDRERLEVTPLYLHGVFVKGFLKGYKAVTDIPNVNFSSHNQMREAIEFGRWITEHNWSGGYNKDGEDFHFNNDFESKTVEELYEMFIESQPKQKEDKEPDIVSLNEKPILNERFADNGEHSHWELLNDKGEIIWTEDTEEPVSDTHVTDIPKQETPFSGEWKLLGHSGQIGDTGDYDGFWEITNGKVSILTKDDDIELLQPIVAALNNSGCTFYQDDYYEWENSQLKKEIERLSFAEPDIVEDEQEIWDDFSEQIDDDEETLCYYAGQNVITRESFNYMLTKFTIKRKP